MLKSKERIEELTVLNLKYFHLMCKLKMLLREASELKAEIESLEGGKCITTQT